MYDFYNKYIENGGLVTLFPDFQNLTWKLCIYGQLNFWRAYIIILVVETNGGF